MKAGSSGKIPRLSIEEVPMRAAQCLRFVPATALITGAWLLLGAPGLQAFTTLGGSLDLGERDVRIFNNFADPEANDNQTPHPSWPGYVGAPMAVWKAVAEWGSKLHGDGAGDPTQTIGSGGANFDVTWQGNAPNAGPNTVSATTNCGAGVLSIFEVLADGWRIRLCEDGLWDDGPGTNIVGTDIQGVVAHEYGHALGLGHSNVGGATMFPSLSGNGVFARSIEADDIAGVQFIYGVASASKPFIDYVLATGTSVAIVGGNFDFSGNEVWFTQANLNSTGDPIKVTGLISGAGGTLIQLNLPASAGPGDILVKTPSSLASALSNAFPFDPSICSEPVVYCTAKVNSLGCASAIGSIGAPSASAGSGFVVTATNVLNNVTGVLFYGKSGPAATPFQDGFLCAQSPVIRTLGQNSGGDPPPIANCSGTFGLDFNAWIAGGSDPSLIPGQEVWAQYWSRDPLLPPPNNTTLSNALAFVVCP